MNRINELIRDAREFGIGYGFKSGFSRAVHNNIMLEEAVYSILKRENKRVLDEIGKGLPSNEAKGGNIVWTFWWQGMESLPEILKICYESHKTNIQCSEIDYRVITKDNVDQYISIPSIINQRLANGEMSFTHFSDYLRVCILEQYGGAWIDITLLVTQPLDLRIFDYTFYSINLGLPVSSSDGVGKIATQTKWAGFMMCASTPHTELFVFLKKALTDYWSNHNYAINYFFMNVLIRIAYDSCASIRDDINMVPLNNMNLYNLQPIINDKFDISKWTKLNIGTTFFKLTQKKQAYEKNDLGECTYYGYLKEKYKAL